MRERPNRRDTHRINERIRVPQVRVIGPDGKQLGVMRTRDALELAYSMGLDLVEVAPNARPPVAKIMDYGKYRYLEKKRKKEAKKKQGGEVKEIEFRPNIGQHDLEVKVRRIREFLEDGNKVKIRVFFRGREIVHKDRGYEVLNRVLDMIRDLGDAEAQPKMEGRNLICIVRPVRKGGKSPQKQEAETKEGGE